MELDYINVQAGHGIWESFTTFGINTYTSSSIRTLYIILYYCFLTYAADVPTISLKLIFIVSTYKPQSIEGIVFIIVVRYAVVFGGTILQTLVGCLIY